MERDAIKARMRARLLDARDDYRTLLKDGATQALGLRVDVLVPRASADAGLRNALDPERAATQTQAITRAVLAEVRTALGADRRPLESWVPPEARTRLERLAARPGLIDKSYVETLFRERAIEALLADTLYTALRDFSTVLPRLILSLLPTGKLGMLGAAAGIGTKLVEELERRLEPELRNFLGAGTKRALAQAAAFATARMDDPLSVELRQNVLRFVLKQSPSFHLRALDASLSAELEAISAAIARQLVADPETPRRMGEALERLYAAHGASTVEALLAWLGRPAGPPTDAEVDGWVEASWPTVRALLDLPAVHALVDRLVDETLDLAAQA